MRKFDNPLVDFGYCVYRWVAAIADPLQLLKALPGFFSYWSDWFRYVRLEGSEKIRLVDTYPRLHEKTKTTTFDSHYFFQDIWAFKKIQQSSTQWHVDVGSRIDLIGFLTAICKVTFIDIRPLEAALDNFESKKGSILALPYFDNSVPSLSCLHVAEHIGLGRYGDALDPYGTRKACAELSRTLARGGNLYFSTPVGIPRLCFNAHRVHSPQQILTYLHQLQLKEFSGIDDNGVFRRNIDIHALDGEHYACGLFHFTKS
jgi:hypothetical protein